MKIGFDARLVHQTGVGRYIQNILRGLAATDTTNEYVIYLPHDATYDGPFPVKSTVKKVNIRWHTIREQVILPWLFWRDKVDVVHIPYFSIPIGYPGRMVVTMHDLILFHEKTGRASTLPTWVYAIKHQFYRWVVQIGLRKASHIIAVSESTKNDLVYTLGIERTKVSVILETIDMSFTQIPSLARIIPNPYYLIVGNAYPHKNLFFLIDVVMEVVKHRTDLQFVFAGPKSIFMLQLVQHIKKLQLSKSVTIMMNVEPRLLSSLYQHAEAVLSPSLQEGFGFPPIEGLAFGTPAIVSDIPVHRELLSDYAILLPLEQTIWIAELRKSHRRNKPQIPSALPRTWDDIARKTRKIYENCVGL